MKHTPGPWYLQETSQDRIIKAGDPVKNWSGGTWIASLPVPGPTGFIGEKTPGEFEANARLIVAAPDMLLALGAVENLLTRQEPWGAEELTVLLHLVQTVKAKAEGKRK